MLVLPEPTALPSKVVTDPLVFAAGAAALPNIPGLEAAEYPPIPPPISPEIAPAFTLPPVTLAVIAPSPAPTIAELTTAPAVVVIAAATPALTNAEPAIALAIAGAAIGIATAATTAITFFTPPP